MRSAELARVKCILVAPFENASDAPLAAEAATGALLGGIDPGRAKVFPIPDLRWLFRDTALELPEGIPPRLALELGGLLGADAAFFGAVEGRSRGPDGFVLVSVRLSMVADRELAFATTVQARPSLGESLEGAVRRATLDAARPVLERIGSPGHRTCFGRERIARLRALALAEPSKPAREVATNTVASAAPAPALDPAPATAGASKAAARPRTPRQAAWAKKLSGRGRILLEDVAFSGRTARLARDPGLLDLAGALEASPEVKVRIEGYVDGTSNPSGDARLSAQMAVAAGKRLESLGVPRERISTRGRGGESPILPNFTARGRASNRRIEVVGIR